jgi:hypothetical protein
MVLYFGTIVNLDKVFLNVWINQTLPFMLETIVAQKVQIIWHCCGLVVLQRYVIESNVVWLGR